MHSPLEWKIPCTQAIYCLELGNSYLLVQLMMGLINELMNVIQEPLLLLSIDCKEVLGLGRFDSVPSLLNSDNTVKTLLFAIKHANIPKGGIYS